MLLRLRKLDDTGLSDEDILATLQKEFGGPDTVEEIWQERALLVTGESTNLPVTSLNQECHLDIISRTQRRWYMEHTDGEESRRNGQFGQDCNGDHDRVASVV